MRITSKDSRRSERLGDDLSRAVGGGTQVRARRGRIGWAPPEDQRIWDWRAGRSGRRPIESRAPSS